MTIEKRNELVNEILERANSILLRKGSDYASKEDTNANFKKVAEMTGQTPLQVWSVYFIKQVLGITNAIKLNPVKPEPKGEPLSERIVDVINYACILYTLILEENE